MNISIFGLGYVGCVSMACLAHNGHTVIGVDVIKSKIDALNNGKSPIIENQIDDLIEKAFKSNKIKSTDNSIEAIHKSDISFICVGTPSTETGHLNLNAIFKVSEEIAKGIKTKKDFHIVVIRSTVLPGTNSKVADIIENASGKKNDVDFAVVSNPEFLREGTAVTDFFSPPYSLVGTENQIAIDSLKEIYNDINAPFITTDIKTAELMKYVNNAFHATKIVFANEVGNICKKLSLDSHKLMEIFCMDTKLNISSYYLRPGFAYGGSCLPKDLKALKTIAHDHYLTSPLLDSIETSNENQKQIVLDQIIQFGHLRIGFFGLSFKAGTDDLRNSPIIDIIERLLGRGFDIKIFDKNVHLSKLFGANKDYILKKIPLISSFVTDNFAEVVDHSQVIVIVNNDPEYNKILEDLKDEKIIYDLVNLDYNSRSSYREYHGVSW